MNSFPHSTSHRTCFCHQQFIKEVGKANRDTTFILHPKLSLTLFKERVIIVIELNGIKIEERERDLERLIDLREEIGGVVRHKAEKCRESGFCVFRRNPPHQSHRSFHLSLSLSLLSNSDLTRRKHAYHRPRRQ